GVFFIGFVARPIGAAIFGHYGDRIGRKATLIVTLLMTGIATAAVGLVPGYDMIGIWGAVILTLLRLIQGIGVGGEWGGSVLLAMEWARGNKNRGFIAAWPQFSAPGALSDRIGRRQMYIIGCIFVAIFTFVYFAMLDTRIPWVIFTAVALSFIPVMTMYGPEAALIAEAFTPRLRYSGASIGYQLASIIAGGPAPFISTWLFATYNSTVPIGIYVVICAVISIGATLMLPDYT